MRRQTSIRAEGISDFTSGLGNFRDHVPNLLASVALLALITTFAPGARAACSAPSKAKFGITSPESNFLPGEGNIARFFEEKAEVEEASIVGLWHVFFVSGGQPFDEGFDEWHSDGTEILNDNAPPQPANGAGTVCLGVYKKIAPATYKLRHPFWSFDANGNLAGSGVILETVTLDADGDSFHGSFTFDLYNLSGNLISEVTGDLSAKRITVD